MASGILGERIRKVRDIRKLEQSDVVKRIEALKLTDNFIDETIRRGELAVATVSRWENGQRSPSSGYVHLLARALEVNYDEEMYWLGLAGHLAPTPIPTKEQIKSILDVYYREIQNNIFPSFILDHHNNIWGINPASTVFVGGYERAVELMEGKIVNVFRLFFDSTLKLSTNLTEIEGIRKQQVLRFMMTNLYRRHEPFWQTYPEYWRNQIPEEKDYHQFEAMWADFKKEYFDSFEGANRLLQTVIDYSYVEFQIGLEKSVVFKVLAETPSYFANNFFQVLHYVLVNENDRLEAESFFRQFQGNDTRKLLKWQISEVDKILAEYV